MQRSASTAWPAAATPSTRAPFYRNVASDSGLTRFLDANRAPPRDQVRGRASLENALVGFLLLRRLFGRRFGFGYGRAFGNRRTRQFGVVHRFVGSASERDISADLTVDDGIARNNLALAGRAVPDDPKTALRKSAGCGHADHGAGQH